MKFLSLKCLAFAFAAGLGAMMITGCAVNTPINITSAEVPLGQAKVGVATCRSFFGIFRFGKCTLSDAIEKGQITAVQSADRKLFTLWIYQSDKIIVRGK